MRKEEENIKKPFYNFFYTWRVENVHLCWQKNKENLKSLTFEIGWLHKNSFNLCLYPRGIADNEDHISYYVAGEDKASFLHKGIKTDLYMLAADGSKIQPESSDGYYSMRKDGMLGYSQYISRKNLLDDNSNYLPDSILTLCCRIWGEHELELQDKKVPRKVKVYARTQIKKEVISKLMVINSNTLQEQTIGEIRPILEDNQIATFSASLAKISGDRSLTIGIDAKNNDKILMAILKLMLIDEKRKKFFWKNLYTWNDFTNLKKIVLSSHFPQYTEHYVPNEMFTEKFLFLVCQFSFTTGFAMQKQEKEDYGTNLYHLLSQPLSSPVQTEQCTSLTDALMKMYLDKASHDICIQTDTSSITAHNMVLSSRSDKFKYMAKTRDEETSVKTIKVDVDADTMKKVVYFLYTDLIPDINWKTATAMYGAAIKYGLELLKQKCCIFIKNKLNKSNVVEIILLAKEYKDVTLNTVATKFILENEFAVFNSDEWSNFMQSDPNLAAQVMLSKYQSK